MKHRLAFDRTHALALVAVLVLHGGLLYALWTVRVPARPDEAKILYVSLIEPSAQPARERPRATPAPSMPPAPASPRLERKAEPAARPDRAAAEQKSAPAPKWESAPVPAAPAELAVDAPTTSPAQTSAPPTSSALDSAGENAAGSGAGGAQSGLASDGPVTLASELALVCAERRAPPYPSVSRRLGEAGRVVLRVELDATGRVIQAQVVDSSGFARLDAAALAAVRNWRCEPPRRDGRTVGAVALQPFDFTLDGP